MTPSEKPQDPDSRTQGDPDSTSTMTRATDGSATGTNARSSAGHGGRGGGDGAQGADSSHADGAAQDSEDTPPWQRSTSTSVTSDGSAHQTATPGASPSSGAHPEGAPVSGPAAPGPGVAGPPVSGPDAEDTQSIPHPLRGTSLGDGATDGSGAAGTDSARGGRTTVSFAGTSTANAGAQPGGHATATQGASRRPSRGPRRASLQVKRVDPWSVLKLALVLSVALFFVWMIAIAVIYGVLGGMGVWDQLNGTFTELTQPENSIGEPLISAGRVFGVASIIGAINIVLITALATVAAFIYNVAADFAGGVEVTLSERE